jgi:hypothetical protein
MRPAFTRLLLLAACLGACAPLRIYHQPGVEVAQMQRDLLACEINALQSAPVANEIRQAPPRYVPARRYCDSTGACYTRGGFFIDGEIFTVDTNAELRTRVERQCMNDQGYQYVEIPNCATGIADRVPVAATVVLPQIGPQSCAIRNEDGTFQIVDVKS